MDWSYTLLETVEQIVLQRLAVFAGAWTLEAAEAVCVDATIPAGTVMQHIVRLVDKSLVSVEQPEGMPTRYRMLETVRQYARERLIAAGAQALLAAEERHAAWYLALAERTEPELAGAGQVETLARLEADHDNLRAALRWTFADSARAEQAGRLVAALWRFWEIRVHWTEADHWLKQALDLRSQLPTPLRIRVLNAASTFALDVMDHEPVAAFLEEALSLQRDVGDRAGVATSLHKLALLHHRHGENDDAIALYEESLALRQALGDSRGMASSLNNLGVIATGSMRYQEAVSYFEESRDLYRIVGDLVNVAYSLNNTGVAVRKLGDLAGALSHYQQALDLFRRLGEQWGIAASLNNMGLIACRHGDYATAQTYYRKSMTLWREMGDKLCMLESLEGWAVLAMAQDDPQRGTRLFGAVHAARLLLKMPVEASDQEGQASLLALARSRLGEDAFQTAWSEGESMTLDDAIRYALAYGPAVSIERDRPAAVTRAR
jgi:tetratricopeptide (TPR) repeat protein